MKLKDIILITVIAFVILGAASVIWDTANAELPIYEDTVTFTIPENGTVSIRGCYFAEFSEENGIDYRCQWHINVDDVEAFLEELLDEFDERRAALEELQDEPVDEPTSNFIPEEKPKELTTFEAKLEYYEENPPETYDQLDEMQKLETLKECENRQGIENLQGIQNERIIWSSKYIDTNPTPHTGVASPIDIAIQECIAQLQAELLSGRGRPTIEGEFLSAQDFFERLQPTHQEMVIINEDDWPEIFTHENYLQPKQEDFSPEQQLMCNSNKVLPEYKQENGCSPEQIAILCIAVECQPDEMVMNTAVANGSAWISGLVGDGNFFNGWDTASILARMAGGTDHHHYTHPDGGGVLPTEGWNMTPESEWTDEQRVKCGQVEGVATAYERAICGQTG